MATKKPSRLTRRAALAAAGAGAVTALGALLTPASATTYRPTVRRNPYNGYYSNRYGRRTRIVISDYYGSSYNYYYYGG
ncbi:transcriptional initiation protein Tat [uncultured Rothia sp.]|uniref:transcriptional initiation protein Tat n=1 Tax=uncultured Rothia sp. TaxID=316088 RepID=UPI0028DBF765|nr:transcriptional initiation protein Tat [uncultured Rothia sp.]